MSGRRHTSEVSNGILLKMKLRSIEHSRVCRLDVMVKGTEIVSKRCEFESQQGKKKFSVFKMLITDHCWRRMIQKKQQQNYNTKPVMIRLHEVRQVSPTGFCNNTHCVVAKRLGLHAQGLSSDSRKGEKFFGWMADHCCWPSRLNST